MLKPTIFTELNPDQRRESINARQRFQAWRDARARADTLRGSMIWTQVKGRDYLVRSAYDKAGRRRQTSLGPRNEETERIRADYDEARAVAVERLASLEEGMRRQSAINRALDLGRVPLLSAKIIRLLDRSGLLGAGLRILGTHALYAYEAVAGVQFDAGLLATQDVDLLFDSSARLAFVANEEVEAASLLQILRRVDKSFERTSQAFRAANRDGYLVDLIKPLRNPPWTRDSERLGADERDLAAVEIEKLDWHESAPAFDAVAIDEKGEPLRMVTSDPRVFAIHKLWLSERSDREPIKRARDRAQAEAVAALTASHFAHLPADPAELRMMPKALVERALPLFRAS